MVARHLDQTQVRGAAGHISVGVGHRHRALELQLALSTLHEEVKGQRFAGAGREEADGAVPAERLHRVGRAVPCRARYSRLAQVSCSSKATRRPTSSIRCGNATMSRPPLALSRSQPAWH